MRARTSSERRVGRRNLVAGILFGVIVATVAGAYATTVFKKMVAGQPATAADVNAAHQDLATAIDKLETTVNAQAAKIAKLETDPDCPPGYAKDTTVTLFTLCKQGKDEMVKVGSFWADRYEASLVDATTWNGGKCDGSGTQYGAGTTDDYPSTFPDSGNWTSKVHACSKSGVVPSRMMTWFQAQQACGLSGKTLCTNGQWQMAAAGTYDAGSYNGASGGSCHTSGTAPRKTGMAGSVPGASTACISSWGAEDMIGNLWEWADLWGQAGKVNASYSTGAKVTPWPSGYGDGKDGTWNVNGEAYDGSKWTTGLPAAALRGGYWDHGSDAGVFAVNLSSGPSAWSTSHGARCCRQ